MSATLAAPTADALARAHPEFRGWLALLALVAEEAARPAWDDAVPDLPRAGAPRLAGATLAVDVDAAAAWLGRLLDTAAAAAPALAGAAARLDPLAALEAAVALDAERVGALADTAGVPREPLAAVLPLAAYPWLERCGARAGAASEHASGWCPVCGAWATLAEARGLEGARRLRCGRCGADWRAAWLTCVFCGTDAHGRLRGLVGAAGDTRRADGCEACGAWMKSVTTLAPPRVAEVRLLDVATVALDVAALERGWRRPPGLGAALDVRAAPRARRRWWRR